MSTLIYGSNSAKREAAEAGTSKAGAPPSAKTYVDMAAALVPAEVLVVNAFLISFVTSTETKAAGVTTTITDPGTAKLIFWISIAVSIAIYFIGEFPTASKAGLKWFRPARFARALIPALAYVAWTMLTKASVFTAVAPDMSEGRKVTFAAFGAILLALFAKGLGDRADGSDPASK